MSNQIYGRVNATSSGALTVSGGAVHSASARTTRRAAALIGSRLATATAQRF